MQKTENDRGAREPAQPGDDGAPGSKWAPGPLDPGRAGEATGEEGSLASAAREPNRAAALAKALLRTCATLAIVALAVLAAMVTWSYYVTAPWTRDGRVRVQVASVAPQVSGQITEVRIVDNQFVHRGDILYRIDPFDFQVALDGARAQERMKAADLQVKRTQAERRQTLSALATTPEEQQQFVGSATQARAAFEDAQAQASQAEINLRRTEVRSPVNGFVTNLLMRVGDYGHAGAVNVSVIDADSYWIDGYFEETKMAGICVGARAEARLMGYGAPIVGRVQSVTRGISVSDAAPSTQGLPSVDPVYTWVRLAQRVPVRIAITDVPLGIPLVSGLTATVTLTDGAPDRSLRATLGRAVSGIMDAVSPSLPTPACVPETGGPDVIPTTLPTPQPTPRRSPGEINPGLAPSMTGPPDQR